MTVRQLGNGAILVQYWQDGKALDAAFPDWGLFVAWLIDKLNIQTEGGK